jgi:serine phosphatase RsbU (regulator of sigma subunit)
MVRTAKRISRLLPLDLEILRQKREIGDSLRYARIIQKAVFPSKKLIEKIFPGHFILLLPKDILSGDFYWLTKKEKQILFAVADCTGHGVPGALMSVLGISFLNELVSHPCSFKANRLLNQMREKVMKALGQTGEDDISKDGMDIAMCIIDEETNILQYSGANNSLYIVRNGEMIILRPDQMQVGVHAIEERSFTNHEILIEDGDIVYLFSDGFPDQFGGPRNKKFLYTNFRSLILSIFHLPMDEQKEILKKTITEWMGDQEQIDDILVMGIKLSLNNNKKS